MNKMTKARASLKHFKNPVIRERLLMVQAAMKHPLRDVAKNHGCTHGKVDFWKKRYEQYGVSGLSTQPRSGRPPKITHLQAQKIKRQVRKHNVKKGWRTKHVRELIVKEAGVKYSFRHTIRIIQSWGLSKIKPRPRYAFSKQDDRDEFIKKTQPPLPPHPSN
jgi:transposase